MDSSLKTATQCSAAVKNVIEWQELLGKEKRTKQKSFLCLYVNACCACIQNAVHSFSHPTEKDYIWAWKYGEKGKKEKKHCKYGLSLHTTDWGDLDVGKKWDSYQVSEQGYI